MKEDAKKPLDLDEEFVQKTPVQTSQGTVYARPLGNGRWSSISGSADAATLGKAALRVLTGPEEKTGNEAALRDDVFERLSPDDLQNLASAVANANRLGDLPAGRSRNADMPVLRSRSSMRRSRSAAAWPNRRPKKSRFSNTDSVG